MSKQYYTDKEYKALLSRLCILIATNEQKPEHIKAFFDKKGIKYADKALKTGDYCFKILADASVGDFVDRYFTDELMVERKNSLSELASSINNEAFHYELKRSQGIKNKYLLVECDGNGWADLLAHKYQSQYNEKSFWQTLHTFEVKYGLKIKFVPKDKMGLEIYTICKTVLDSEILK